MATSPVAPPFVVMPENPMGHPSNPNAVWYPWPTGVRVFVPEVVLEPLPDISFGPIMRVINPNTLDRITLFASRLVRVEPPFPDIETQIRMAPLAGSAMEDDSHLPVTKGMATLLDFPLVQQVAGISGIQFTLYARTVGPNAKRCSVAWVMLGCTSGCCEKAQFNP